LDHYGRRQDGSVGECCKVSIEQKASSFSWSMIDAVMYDLQEKGTVWPVTAREDLLLVLQLTFTKGYQAGCRDCLRTSSAPESFKASP
jgi:hypothetical protein